MEKPVASTSLDRRSVLVRTGVALAGLTTTRTASATGDESLRIEPGQIIDAGARILRDEPSRDASGTFYNVQLPVQLGIIGEGFHEDDETFVVDAWHEIDMEFAGKERWTAITAEYLERSDRATIDRHVDDIEPDRPFKIAGYPTYLYPKIPTGDDDGEFEPIKVEYGRGGFTRSSVLVDDVGSHWIEVEAASKTFPDDSSSGYLWAGSLTHNDDPDKVDAGELLDIKASHAPVYAEPDRRSDVLGDVSNNDSAYITTGSVLGVDGEEWVQAAFGMDAVDDGWIWVGHLELGQPRSPSPPPDFDG